MTSEAPVILIVDDQSSDVLILSEALHDLGEVISATDGRTALEIARFCRPDLVLLDIQMPGMNGFDICRVMKSDPKLCDAAILFVTSHTQSDNEIKALELGGVDFIQKPLNIPVAKAHVRAHLNLRREAKRLAYYDALTGLPNRALLQDRAEQALQKARRNGDKVALLLLDLDNFKSINDSVGHSVGDALLQEIAKRLAGSSRGIDTVCRPGGDEFLILLPDMQRMDAIGDYIERLLKSLAAPIELEKNRYDLTASVGVSVFPDDSDSPEALHRHADAAMYLAKREGRNRYHFFSQSIETSTRARHLLESHMRRALEQGVFEAFYQTKYDAQRQAICGMEALIRWRNGEGKLVSPADFIPLAEETGLIVPIGKYMLLQACADARRLHQCGHPISVSVNISAVQFREESFLDMVKSALHETQLPPAMLELEITEGVLAHDIGEAAKLLAELKRLGVSIAIDDFGTGYSSLTYLKRLPIDVLKIDQGFVRDMLTDSSDAAIIEAIVRMGQALGLALVAEGVEQQAQADKLQELGCQTLQGYLYCRPMPFAELQQLLSGGTVKVVGDQHS
ncbi:two-component system response regulator [Pseudomonas sp. BMS12]|uniref:two-component system response regulator n=1 Tax=Pseudomonas sp. BMS12 TaxID=1796033 RepID=UPI000AD7906F|nr:EAL domain-containing protein [Pseudomonas sp. BMS12]